MKKPRISITGIMVAAMLIALDCATVRAIMSRPRILAGELLEITICLLPMANAVAVGVAFLIRRRGRGNGFLRGFVAGGVMAMALFASCAIWRMDWLGSYLEASGSWISRVIGWDIASVGETFVLACLIPTLIVPPQFLLALACGWASGRLASRPPGPAEAEPASQRLRLVSAVVLLILAAAPYLAVEMYFRRYIDPLVARLMVDSRAVIDIYSGMVPGSDGKQPRVPPFGLTQPEWTDGTTVRIVADDEPSLLQAWTTQQGSQVSETQFSDLRLVRVTLLDGTDAGQTRSVPYYVLRPIR